ncbi:MAG: hypothetical protein IT384_25955 [Deltaproteobacteria bacterium]|nr:hypothetical protein [Deltaproteobacteria bacterium]
MSSSPFGPPQLGADNVVRFSSPEHFLRDHDENLKLGRLFVRSKRTFTTQSRLTLTIEGPGVGWTVSAEAVVLLSRAGFVGLELADFEREVRSALELLVEEVERASAGDRSAKPRDEATHVGEPPDSSLGTRIEPNPYFAKGSHPPSSPPPRPVPEPRAVRKSLEPLPAKDALDPETSGALIDARTLPLQERPSVAAPRPGVPDARTLKTRRTIEPPANPARSVAPPPRPSAGLPAPSVPPEAAEPTIHIPVRPAEAEHDVDDDLAMGDSLVLSPRSSTPPPASSSSSSSRSRSRSRSSDEDLSADLSADLPGETSDGDEPGDSDDGDGTAPARGCVVPAEGVEALQDSDLHLPRMTSGGVLRAADLVDLLGLYLSALRHGVITVLGGPSGSPGDSVSIKIASRHVVTLEAEIVARMGEWLTLRIPATGEIESLLADHPADWLPAVEALAPKSARSSFAPPAPPSIPPAAPSHPPPAPPSIPPVEMSPVIGRPTIAPPPSSPSLAPAASFKIDEGGAPQSPKLEDGRLVFRAIKDVNHEISTNLRNGGLFAISAPLPIRSQHSLRIFIGGIDTGVIVSADVVFASGGRVGFSVGSFADAVAALEKIIKEGPPGGRPAAPSVPPSAVPSVAPLGGVTSIPPGTSFPAGASIPPGASQLAAQSIPPPPGGRQSLPPQLAGNISRPPAKNELLELQRIRSEGEIDLENISAIALFDHLVRNRARGVLTLKHNRETKTVYFHEGSIAFIEARPIVEEHCLGRILVQGKKINDIALREGLERARAQKKPLGRTLVAAGHVSANALVAALRDQTRMKIEPAFEIENGTYEWGPWQEPPTRADLVLTNGLGIVCRYFRHIFDHTTVNDIEELLQSAMRRVVLPSEELDMQSPVLGLQPKELRFIEMSVDGKRNIGDMLVGSALGRLASLRLLAFGLAAGFLRFKDGSRPSSAKRPASRPASDAGGFKAMKRALEQDLQLLKGQNYFDVLGVHWSAHYRTFPTAYAKARAPWDTKKGELRDAPPEVVEVAKQGLAVIEKAYRLLTNESERINYRKQLFDATEREYSADMLVKQGEVLMLRGDRVGGLEAFETAVELAPTGRNRQLLAAAREGKSI